MTTCEFCDQPVEPGQRGVSWFAKGGPPEFITTERGAVHLRCLGPNHTNGSTQ